MNKFKQRRAIKKVSKVIPIIGINELLNNIEKLIQKENKTVIKGQPSKDIQKSIENFIEVLSSFKKAGIPTYKDYFLKDEKSPKGYVRKSLVNTFKICKYRKIFDAYISTTKKNKYNSLDDWFNYCYFHDLSVNRDELIKTFNVLEQALPVIIDNLKKNDIVGAFILMQDTYKLIKRLYALYGLYGYYLKDNNCKLTYDVGIAVFQKLDETFEEIKRIAKKVMFA